jgi:5-methylcytosine-specific restriction endonuclease McrA
MDDEKKFIFGKNLCKECHSAKCHERYLKRKSPDYIKPIKQQPVDINNKICSKCGKEKSKEEFAKWRCWCKDCKKKYNKKYKKIYYVKNKEKILQLSLEWKKKNSERAKEIAKKSVLKNIEKIKISKKKYRDEKREKNPFYRKEERQRNLEHNKEIDRIYRNNHKEEIKQYSILNKEKILEHKRIRYANDEEYRKKINERNKIWTMENSDTVRIRRKKWMEKNPDHRKKYYQSINGKEIIKSHNLKRERLLKGKMCDLNGNQWEEIKKSQNYRCAYCGKPESDSKLTQDHIVPISKGGNHTMANIQGLCKSCNSIKHNKLDFTWYIISMISEGYDVIDGLIIGAQECVQ